MKGWWVLSFYYHYIVDQHAELVVCDVSWFKELYVFKCCSTRKFFQTPIQPVFAFTPECCVHSPETANINLKAFCLTHSWSSNHYTTEKFRWWRGALNTTFCVKVCKWLAAGRWFLPDTPVSATNKTDHLDITEILLKVALNTIILTPLPRIFHDVHVLDVW